MTISERINSIAPYFREMQVTTVDGSTVIYVVVKFPDRWIVDESVSEKYKVVVQRGREPGEFYFCGDVADGEDNVFNAVEYSVKKMKEALERSRLLTEKVNELTSIFSDESIPLESLRNMSISYDRQQTTSVTELISQVTAPSAVEKPAVSGTYEETAVSGAHEEPASDGASPVSSRRKKN